MRRKFLKNFGKIRTNFELSKAIFINFTEETRHNSKRIRKSREIHAEKIITMFFYLKINTWIAQVYLLGTVNTAC